MSRFSTPLVMNSSSKPEVEHEDMEAARQSTQSAGAGCVVRDVMLKFSPLKTIRYCDMWYRTLYLQNVFKSASYSATWRPSEEWLATRFWVRALCLGNTGTEPSFWMCKMPHILFYARRKNRASCLYLVVLHVTKPLIKNKCCCWAKKISSL